MYHGSSKPSVWKVYRQLSSRDSVNEKRQSALKLALVEFAVVFVSEVGWSLVRKTGQSMIDDFGIALCTAILLFAFHNK
jgi:hypothetical protein